MDKTGRLSYFVGVRRPKQERSEAARSRILDAAMDLVAERGMAGVSHRAVAARAGVSLSATSYYFESLADLEHAAIVEHYGRRLDDYRRAAQSLQLLDLSATEMAAAAAELFTSSAIELVTAHLEVYLNAARRSDLRDALQPVFATMRELMSAVAEQLGIADAATFATAATAIVEGVQLRRVAEGIDGREELERSLTMLTAGALVSRDSVLTHTGRYQ
jgi:TetR/AcrR family transcriptional regulator, regulator of biofilm formation and stress response